MTAPDELLLLRALLRATDYGVLLSNAERRDLVCNRRFCELFGLDEQQTLQSLPEQVRASVLPRLKAPEEFLAVLDAVYADPDLTREDEVELVAPRRRLLRRYTAPVRDDDGYLIGRLWTFVDITHARSLERKVQAQADQLRAQARQLATALKAASGHLNKVENTLTLTQQQLFESEKLSAVGLLAASVAHDIRNILTPLNIELSLADQDDREARGESLTVMRQQIDRLSLMTHRLLALAKPDRLERIPLDLAEMTHRIAELLRPQAAVDGVEVVSHRPASLPCVPGDAVQVEQVLVNLVLNGVQAMQAEGGLLSLTLRHSAQAGCRGVAVCVRDTGPGIPLAHRRRLFDPFFTTKPDGAGLGLFSCRRIAQAHGGTIRIQSRLNVGTQVTLWLPRDPSSEEDTHGR